MIEPLNALTVAIGALSVAIVIVSGLSLVRDVALLDQPALAIATLVIGGIGGLAILRSLEGEAFSVGGFAMAALAFGLFAVIAR